MNFWKKLSVSPREWRIVLLTALAAIVLSALPVILALLWAPAGTVYTGIHTFTPGDYNVYFSYFEQVKQGNLLFKDLFTAEEQLRHIFNPFWLLAGALGALLHLPNLATLHIVRSLLIPVFAGAVYLLISLFLQRPRQRLAAFFLIMFAGGWGALLAPILEPFRYLAGGYYHWPPDLWVPEALGWLSIYNAPHILFSTILMIVLLVAVLLITGETSITVGKKTKLILAITAGGSSLFWFLFHPFHIVSMTAVIVVYFLYLLLSDRRRALRSLPYLLLIALLASPGVIYHLWLLVADPLAQARADQNQCITPVWWLVLIGYGFLLLGGITGLLAAIIKRKKPYAFLAIWFVVQAVIIYIPLNYQRRMIQGWYLPMIILAVIGLYEIRPWLARKIGQKLWGALTIPGFVIIMATLGLFLSSIYVFPADLYLFRHPPRGVIYKSAEWEQSMDWIRQSTSEDAIFLSGTINGSFLPGWTGRTVYLGHGVETVNYLDKVNAYLKFMGDGPTAEKQQLLIDNKIDYIFYGAEEKTDGILPSDLISSLMPVFQNGEVTIYQVKK